MYKLISLLIAILLLSFNLNATTYFSDPINGSMSNTGSTTEPWSSLEDIMNSGFVFQANDIIKLRTGNHGFPKINGINNGFVQIMPDQNQYPIINRIYIGSVSTTSFWKLSGLNIQSIRTGQYPINLIDIYPNCSNIVIENCIISTSENTQAWTRDDWRNNCNTGIRAQGYNIKVMGNTIKNIAVGISMEADSSLISENTIQYFTIDGIRGLANNCIYESNTITDNMVVFTYSENHYDGFQSYTCCPVGSDTIRNVIIRKNLIINTTDSTRNFRGPMQGISNFDGFYVNWTIENNIIITDHWHGITMLGAINCRIINNTVIDPYDISPIDPYDSLSTDQHGPAWIMIAAHKNGTPSYNNTVRNNLTAAINNDNNIGDVDHNIIIGASSNYDNYFTDYNVFDLHLISSATAIDNGSNVMAPTTDFDNNPRPNGNSFDIGAFEFQQTTSVQNINYSKLSIVPNPAKDFINIKAKNIDNIYIFDITGKLIITKTNQNTNNEVLIDISKLNKGLYFVKVGDTTAKFVKH